MLLIAAINSIKNVIHLKALVTTATVRQMVSSLWFIFEVHSIFIRKLANQSIRPMVMFVTYPVVGSLPSSTGYNTDINNMSTNCNCDIMSS